MRRVRKKPVYYDFTIRPARWNWTVPTPVERRNISTFLKALEAAVFERFGAEHYEADAESYKTHCRYEWNFQARGWAEVLRVGCEIDVIGDQAGDLACFATTEETVREPWRDPPALPAEIVEAAKLEVSRVLARAANLMLPSAAKTFHVITHLHVGGHCAFGAEVALDDGIRIQPTVVLRGRNWKTSRVSAVVTTVRAVNKQRARSPAQRQTAIVAALATLGTSLPCVPVSLEWPRHRRRDFLRQVTDRIPACSLYPAHSVLPEGCPEISAALPRTLCDLWQARRNLSEPDRAIFDQALLAYFGAVELRNDQPTMAVVAIVAALNFLAAPLASECAGQITCAEHGALGFKHRLRGDAASILALAADLLGLEDGSRDARDAKKLVNRVYSKQRSAYVHGAWLRHGEYHDRDGLRASVRPANDGQFSSLAEYANDADCIGFLARRVLIAWLERRSASTRGPKFDPGWPA